MGYSGSVQDYCVVDSGEDSGPFRCFLGGILKNANEAKNGEVGLVFCRFVFVSLGVPSGDVGGCSGDV